MMWYMLQCSMAIISIEKISEGASQLFESGIDPVGSVGRWCEAKFSFKVTGT